MIRHQAGRSCATVGAAERTARTAPEERGSSASRSSISSPFPSSRRPASISASGSGKSGKEPLRLHGLEKAAIAFHDLRGGGEPPLEAFQVHQRAPAGIVVAHP